MKGNVAARSLLMILLKGKEKRGDFSPLGQWISACKCFLIAMLSYWWMELEVSGVDELSKSVDYWRDRISGAMDLDFVPVTASARAGLSTFKPKRVRCC